MILGAIFLNQGTLDAIFDGIFREFAQIFKDFVKVLTDFGQISTDFARIFRDFARIFTNSKLLGVHLYPLHPRLLHHWLQTFFDAELTGIFVTVINNQFLIYIEAIQGWWKFTSNLRDREVMSRRTGERNSARSILHEIATHFSFRRASFEKNL